MAFTSATSATPAIPLELVVSQKAYEQLNLHDPCAAIADFRTPLLRLKFVCFMEELEYKQSLAKAMAALEAELPSQKAAISTVVDEKKLAPRPRLLAARLTAAEVNSALQQAEKSHVELEQQLAYIDARLNESKSPKSAKVEYSIFHRKIETPPAPSKNVLKAAKGLQSVKTELRLMCQKDYAVACSKATDFNRDANSSSEMAQGDVFLTKVKKIERTLQALPSKLLEQVGRLTAFAEQYPGTDSTEALNILKQIGLASVQPPDQKATPPRPK